MNGKKVDIPSLLVKIGDEISLKEDSRSLKVVKESLEATANRVGWVEFDETKFVGKLTREPERNELNQNITEAQIVEYYNRKL